MQDLTILITLKDRSSYTYRLMNHFNKIKCDAKILLADGGKDKQVEDNLRNKANYPNVDYRYIRYPYDKELSDYYNKMKRAAIEVDTPFVLCIDNDDLIIPEGVQKSIDFLKNNKDYAASRGVLQGFSRTKVDGRLEVNGTNMFPEFPDDITGKTAEERFIDQSQHYHTNTHNIMRIQHLILEASIVDRLCPSNLRFVEQLRGFLNVLWGNCHRGEDNYLLHEHGTPRVVGCVDQFPDQNTWITHSDWPKNFAKMTDGIAAGIYMYDSKDLNECREIIRKYYMEMYEKRVSNHDLLREQIEKSKEYYLDYDAIVHLFITVNTHKSYD
jgi:glycosyltransferase domain-containing protein